MLCLTIRNGELAYSRQAALCSRYDFYQGAPTTPFRLEDTSDPHHRQRSRLISDFVGEALALNERVGTRFIRDQSLFFSLADSRDSCSKFFSWGAEGSSEYLIPDPHYLAARGYQDYVNAGDDWLERDDVVFWRGALSRPLSYWTSGPEDFPRYKLISSAHDLPGCDIKACSSDYPLLTGPVYEKEVFLEYEKRYEQLPLRALRSIRTRAFDRISFPEINDAFHKRRIRIIRGKFMRSFADSLQEDGLISAPEPMKSWSKYRYTIDIDGFGPSWKLFPCLALGMVVFKVNSPFSQFFSRHMKPYVHFVPVMSDLSDLSAKIAWARSNPGRSEEISRNARALAAFLSYAWSINIFVEMIP